MSYKPLAAIPPLHTAGKYRLVHRDTKVPVKGFENYAWDYETAREFQRYAADRDGVAGEYVLVRI